MIRCSSLPRVLFQPTTAVLAALLVAMAVSSGPASAQAREPGFYAAGGKFQPLIVSPDEFVIEFESGVDTAALGKTMRTSVGGSLEPIPWAPRSQRFAILRTSKTGMTRRAKIKRSAGIKSVNRVYRTRVGGAPILSTGTIVVAFDPSVTTAERDQILDDYKVELVRAVDGLKNTYVVRPIGDVDDVELNTAASLHEDDRIRYAHPDCRFPLRDSQFGNDPFFGQQFHLSNNGAGDAIAGADINIDTAWNRTFGGGVRIGQLDDACDVMHEDLVDNYIGISHDISNNSQSAAAANPRVAGDRHGTATMGLMVAADFNGVGVRGVAPLATFTASRGLTGPVTASQVAAAFTFARNQSVDVHNNSWGFVDSPNPPVVVSAIETAFLEGRDGLGMVVCFASGNGSGMEEGSSAGVEVDPNMDLSALPIVIGVGASNARDELASYSNFGEEIDLIAPSNDFQPGLSLPAIVTTDNTDATFASIEPGYNNNGLDDDGFPNLADPNYTNNFGGTSAAAPQVAATAALVLSIAPELTASTVRVSLEQTADKVSPSDADYNGITERSLRYGYGRLDAGTAVESAFDGIVWPDRVADVEVDTATKTIRWKQNDDIRDIGDTMFGVETTSVLVVQASGASGFDFVPTDFVTYSTASNLTDPMGSPISAKVVANLDTELFNYDDSQGPLYFGIYPVTQTSRGPTYGFGVAVGTTSPPIDSGTLGFESGDGDGSVVLPPGSTKPNVTISVSPLSGNSPLQVNFLGNAQSTAMIDSFLWDFGDGETSSERITTHTYVVESGTQRYFPRLTVTDINGNIGGRAVAVDVFGEDQTGGGDGEDVALSIVIADPEIPDVDIGGEGFSPLTVLLSAEVSGISGSLEAPEVFWDLGDGNSASSLTISHTYTCPSPNASCRFPITVTVDSTSLTQTLQATRFIEVLANPDATPTPTPGNGNDNSGDNGDGQTMCGLGSVMAFWVVGLFAVIRRKLTA